jgi:hypothetical protein
MKKLTVVLLIACYGDVKPNPLLPAPVPVTTTSPAPQASTAMDTPEDLIENLWGVTKATLSLMEKGKETASRPFHAKLIGSPVVSHEYTLSMMKLMDEIRSEIGLKYP